MAPPRKPKAKAAVDGSDTINRGRYESRNEVSVDSPLGKPPAWIKDTPESKAKSAWLVFEREMPWLNASHRMLVGLACKTQGRIMAGEDIGVGAANMLKQMLGSMGATPSDASKITLPDNGEKDPDEELFNRGGS